MCFAKYAVLHPNSLFCLLVINMHRICAIVAYYATPPPPPPTHPLNHAYVVGLIGNESEIN